ncbi:MAG: hypothetical protein AAF851_06320 [Myxococcota bacterium]
MAGRRGRPKTGEFSAEVFEGRGIQGKDVFAHLDDRFPGFSQSPQFAMYQLSCTYKAPDGIWRRGPHRTFVSPSGEERSFGSNDSPPRAWKRVVDFDPETGKPILQSGPGNSPDLKHLRALAHLMKSYPLSRLELAALEDLMGRTDNLPPRKRFPNRAFWKDECSDKSRKAKERWRRAALCTRRPVN